LDNFWIFLILLWLLLFFGGSVLPCMTGIMLNTVDRPFKTTANSIANLIYNLVGYLPAPSVYGVIYDFGEGGNARGAMATLMYTPIICVTFFSIASLIIINQDILGYKM
jgi:sugar phosphate permease